MTVGGGPIMRPNHAVSMPEGPITRPAHRSVPRNAAKAHATWESMVCSRNYRSGENLSITELPEQRSFTAREPI